MTIMGVVDFLHFNESINNVILFWKRKTSV